MTVLCLSDVLLEQEEEEEKKPLRVIAQGKFEDKEVIEVPLPLPLYMLVCLEGVAMLNRWVYDLVIVGRHPGLLANRPKSAEMPMLAVILVVDSNKDNSTMIGSNGLLQVINDS